MIFTMELNQH